jgi:acetyl esterase/lipase
MTEPPSPTASLRAWPLPARRPGTPADDDLAARRALVDGQPCPVAPGASVREADYGGVPCTVVEPASGQVTASVVYLHGGGHRLGRAAQWADFASVLAARHGIRMILVDYGLSPEQPFPNALHDAAAAYTDACERHGTMAVGGDSAGGGLALALTLAARSADVPPPTRLVMLSPWLRMDPSADSYTANADTDRLFSRQAALEAGALYLQGHDPRDPLASPGLADLKGLPEVLVLAGTAEVLLADTTQFVADAAAAGVGVRAHLAAGMQHVWPKVFPDLPESRAAVDEIGRFLAR